MRKVNDIALQVLAFIKAKFLYDIYMSKISEEQIIDLIKNLGNLRMTYRKRDVIAGYIQIDELIARTFYHLEKLYPVLRWNWKYFEKLLEKFPEEKLKTKRFEGEKLQDYRKRLVEKIISREQKLYEMENEKNAALANAKFLKLQEMFPHDFKDCTFSIAEDRVVGHKVYVTDRDGVYVGYSMAEFLKRCTGELKVFYDNKRKDILWKRDLRQR